jgi:predicted nucleic acid-binding protein
VRPLVLDASAGLKLVIQESDSASVAHLVSERQGTQIAVPEIFWLEVVNVLFRRHRYPAAAVLEAVRALHELGMSTLAADAASTVAVVDLMERHDLTAYDATYLALALALDADLATADHDLALAAGARALRIGSAGIAEEAASYLPRAATWPSWPDAGAYLAQLRAEVSL